MMMVEMELVEIQITGELTGPQVIILQEKKGTRNFPIFIGPHEVSVLDQTVRRVPLSRPLTHELILNVIDGLGGVLTGVVVDELRQETFIGKLLVKTPEGQTERIDSRPSDAIILAMKRKVPIYVAEEVLAMTSGDPEDEPDSEDYGADTEEEDE